MRRNKRKNSKKKGKKVEEVRVPELTSMVGQLKEQMFQLSAIMKDLIKPRNESEEAPTRGAIEKINNKMLESSEQWMKR